jgi:hypothetical protein
LVSPSQTILNGIETFMQGIPRIGATVGLGRASIAMARASAAIMPRQFTRGVGATVEAARGKLGSGEWHSGEQIRQRLLEAGYRADHINPLFDRIIDKNLIGYSSYRDLERMAHPGIATSRAGRVFDTAVDMSTILHSKMEDANRATLAVAAFDSHFSVYKNVDQAVDFAERIVRISGPNYSYPGKARIATNKGAFGAYGIPFTQFRQHAMWAYSQFAVDMRNAFKGATPEIRREAAWAMGFMLLTQGALLGTLNWLADPMRYLFGAYDFLTGRPSHNYQSDFRQAAHRALGPVGGELVSRGLIRGFGYGVGVESRLGWINPVQAPEYRGDYSDPRAWLQVGLEAIAGVPAARTTAGVMAGVGQAFDGQWGKATQSLLPRVLRDPARAYFGETEGIKNAAGRVVQPAERVNPIDTFYRTIGFNSAPQAERVEVKVAQQQYTQEMRGSRTEAVRAAADAFVGSASEKRSAKALIDDHNNRYPHNKITFSDVVDYRRHEIQRLRDPRLSGLTVPQAHQQRLREIGAFGMR